MGMRIHAFINKNVHEYYHVRDRKKERKREKVLNKVFQGKRLKFLNGTHTAKVRKIWHLHKLILMRFFGLLIKLEQAEGHQNELRAISPVTDIR